MTSRLKTVFPGGGGRRSWLYAGGKVGGRSWGPRSLSPSRSEIAGIGHRSLLPAMSESPSRWKMGGAVHLHFVFKCKDFPTPSIFFESRDSSNDTWDAFPGQKPKAMFVWWD
ncbi:hypothetical protein Acr_28g0012310 [Actinidia rufa]|uniref:Uncharacterized protein n=1 Tax=Actinidia rufa TaxID=165716 RepID=A0A7J0HBS2_9ERIC|nr:hypothetical protein Acr_28g0012310 [Actinidia rufa]